MSTKSDWSAILKPTVAGSWSSTPSENKQIHKNFSLNIQEKMIVKGWEYNK